ncbi:MAG: universal stress protein [Peptococcaceae bacterium]|nr:universal stress protein [Peptococcaceae bacterium]
MINNVLVPTDGSEYSMRAAKYAAQLAELNPDIKVTVFTVDSVPRRFVERHLYWVAADKGKQGKNIEDMFAEERNRILEQTEAIFKEKGIEVKCDHSAGNPAEEICEYARTHDIQLIIMGTRGMSGLQEIFMGSVSHKVLHLSPCPVILVK